MKKNIIALSVIAALSTTSFAADINKEMYNQIQALKAQVEALEKKMAEQQAVQTQKTEQVSTTPIVDEKRIEKITDTGIQKILLNHLQQEIYQNAIDEIMATYDLIFSIH